MNDDRTILLRYMKAGAGNLLPRIIAKKQVKLVQLRYEYKCARNQQEKDRLAVEGRLLKEELSQLQLL